MAYFSDMQVLFALVELREAVRHGFDPRYSICTATYEFLTGGVGGYDDDWDEVLCRLGRLFLGWPHHTGDWSYPVPAPDITKIRTLRESGRWVGASGPLRRDLLDYTINKLERELLRKAGIKVRQH